MLLYGYDLAEGDELFIIVGSTASITGAELERPAESIKVYNLEVADFNTYFVGDNSVLVHNYDPQSRNQIQKDVERGKAPNGIDRVDPPHNPNVPNQKTHEHFTDGTSMNYDGTPHDKSHGAPTITKKIAKWLESYNWSSEFHPDTD